MEMTQTMLAFDRIPNLTRAACIVLLGVALTACSSLLVEEDYPDTSDAATEDSGSVFDLFDLRGLFGGQNGDQDNGRDKDAAAQTSAATSPAPGPQSGAATPTPQGLGVNADLWRAALDTISFLPLAEADPIGGTIITDWYNDPGQADERVKMTVIISGLDLRADALRIALFREKRTQGRWTTVATSSRAARQLENIVLTKARDYSIARGDR